MLWLSGEQITDLAVALIETDMLLIYKVLSVSSRGAIGTIITVMLSCSSIEGSPLSAQCCISKGKMLPQPPVLAMLLRVRH